MIASATETEIRSDPTLDGRLLIARSGRLTVSYAPLDYVAASARLVIVGITPGAQQASNALLSARLDILAGHSDADVLRNAKAIASFSGAMRQNLVAMLDSIGLPAAIGLSSRASLWGNDLPLVHFTSALRYPVFTDGGNYRGQPSMTATPVLLALLHEYLAAKAKVLSQAIWLPLGPKAGQGVREMVRLGLLSYSQVLEGLPHPSGANAERIAYFLGRKERGSLSVKTDPAGLDRIREKLLAQVETIVR